MKTDVKKTLDKNKTQTSWKPDVYDLSTKYSSGDNSNNLIKLIYIAITFFVSFVSLLMIRVL